MGSGLGQRKAEVSCADSRGGLTGRAEEGRAATKAESLNRVTTSFTRVSLPAVYTEFARIAPLPSFRSAVVPERRASCSDRGPEHLSECAVETTALLGCHLPGWFLGVDAGSPECLVRVDIPYTCDPFLVEKPGANRGSGSGQGPDQAPLRKAGRKWLGTHGP